MLQTFKNGQTSVVLRVKLLDSSSTTGAGLTGLTSASSGLIISTIADNEASATTYTVAGSTIEAVTTLGTFAAPTATKCRFKEVDSTNHKGVYEFQFADARFAVSNAKSILVSVLGATNLQQADFVVQLQTLDPYLANLTAAQIATGVWTDTTAGDFTTALSVGKSVMNGVSLGTGLTIAAVSGAVGSVTGAVGSVTGLTASNLDTTISSRMATFTQPTGFLAATFPTTVASPTNITSITGNITGNLSGSVGSVTGAVASVTGNVGGNVVGSVASVTARVTANTDQFNGDTTAAANIAKTTKAIGRATVSGSPSTTNIPTSACAPAGAVADQFKGRIITFDADTTTTALRGQATDITASSNSATPTFTVTALTTAPSSGDTFSIT